MPTCVAGRAVDFVGDPRGAKIGRDRNGGGGGRNWVGCCNIDKRSGLGEESLFLNICRERSRNNSPVFLRPALKTAIVVDDSWRSALFAKKNSTSETKKRTTRSFGAKAGKIAILKNSHLTHAAGRPTSSAGNRRRRGKHNTRKAKSRRKNNPETRTHWLKFKQRFAYQQVRQVSQGVERALPQPSPRRARNRRHHFPRGSRRVRRSPRSERRIKHGHHDGEQRRALLGNAKNRQG